LLEYDLTRTNSEYQTYKAILDDFNTNLFKIGIEQLEYENNIENYTIATKYDNINENNKNDIFSFSPPSPPHSSQSISNSPIDIPTTTSSISSHPSPSTPTIPKSALQNLHLLHSTLQISPFSIDPITKLPIWEEWSPDWRILGQLDPFGEDLLPDYDPVLWTHDPKDPTKLALRSELWRKSYELIKSTVKSIRETHVGGNGDPLAFKEGDTRRIFHPKNLKIPGIITVINDRSGTISII
jgi:hypothetical protein